MKHVRRLKGLGASVVSFYARRLMTGEIQSHLAASRAQRPPKACLKMDRRLT